MDNIRQEVFSIIRKIKNIDRDYCEEDGAASLTGDRFRMNTVDLMYLFLEVRKQYNANFIADDVSDYRFNSIDQIVETLEKK